MIPNIKSTTNYSQFHHLTEQRKIDPTRVRSLKRAVTLKNLLSCNPIIVKSFYDNKLYVMEGQHRLEVAKELNLPIYYIIDNTIEINDIILLNTNRVNWKLKDYLKFHEGKGNESYKFVINLHNYTKDFSSSFSTLFNILEMICEQNVSLLDGLKNGDLKIKNKTEVEFFIYATMPVLKKMNKLRQQYVKKSSVYFYFRRAFIRALCRFFTKIKYDQNIYKEALECFNRDEIKFPDSSNVALILEIMLVSYNYKRKKNRLEIEL